MWKPFKKYDAKSTITAFITNENNLNEKTINGTESNCNTGFKKAFRRLITTLANKAERMLSHLTILGKRKQVIRMAIAIINTLIQNLLSVIFGLSPERFTFIIDIIFFLLLDCKDTVFSVFSQYDNTNFLLPR